MSPDKTVNLFAEKFGGQSDSNWQMSFVGCYVLGFSEFITYASINDLYMVKQM